MLIAHLRSTGLCVKSVYAMWTVKSLTPMRVPGVSHLRSPSQAHRAFKLTAAHPFLKRSSTPAEIQGFKRRVPPRPSQAVKRRTSMTPYHEDHLPALGLSPTSSEGSYQSPPDAYQHHLLPDVQEDKAAVFGSVGFGSSFEGSSPEGMRFYPSFSLDRPVFNSTIAMPAAPAAIPPSNLFVDRNIDGIPASAPAHITGFSVSQGGRNDMLGSLGMKISQGHIRTRSVQGEPPSASLYSPFSPSSPLANPGWGAQPLDMQIKDESPRSLEDETGPDPALRGDTALAPTYQLDDPSTWIRRDYSDPHISVPTERTNVFATSLPNDLSPSYQSPGVNGLMEMITPSTVSPGIYQQGFQFDTVRSTQTSTPRQVPSTRAERRASLGGYGTSPYSPRSRPGGVLPLAAIRGVGRDVSGSSQGKERYGGGKETGVQVDEGLPSAGLRLHRGPFEGMLPDDVQMDG